MKKLNLFATGMLAMFVSTVAVHAQDVTAENLKNCLEKESVCTLTADIDSVGVTFITVKGKSATIDLNGKTLTLDHNISVESGTGTRGSLTIKNGTVNVKTSNGTGFMSEEGTDLVIEGVTFKDSSSVSDNPALIQVKGGNDNGTLTIKNSKFTANHTAIGVFPKDNGNVSNVKISVTDTEINANAFAMSVNGLVKTENPRPEITLSGNTFVSDSTAAIYAAGSASWTISSGTYKGADAISVRSGEFNITGGTFEATGTYVKTPTNEAGKSVSTGSAITIASSADNAYAKNVKMNITGGTFKAKEGLAVYEVTTNSQSSALSTLSIEDGTFEAGGKSTFAVYVSNTGVKNYISGGTYKGGTLAQFQSDALAEDLESAVDSTGKTVVGKQYTVTVKNLTAVSGVDSYSKPENFPAVAGERINLKTKLNVIGSPADRNYQYGVKYVIVTADGKRITGLDEFTMPESDVEIDLEIVEVNIDTYEPGEDVIPSTPVNPDEPERDPEAGEKPGDEENPQTGDNVVGSIAMGIAGLVGIVGSALVFDKKTNYNN